MPTWAIIIAVLGGVWFVWQQRQSQLPIVPSDPQVPIDPGPSDPVNPLPKVSRDDVIRCFLLLADEVNATGSEQEKSAVVALQGFVLKAR